MYKKSDKDLNIAQILPAKDVGKSDVVYRKRARMLNDLGDYVILY